MEPPTHPTTRTSHACPNRLSKSPEIEQYMKKKRLEWKRKKKNEIEQTRSKILAKKVKLKNLEKERRERLCVDKSSGHEKLETVRRPRWDSNISSPVSNAHGPWSNLSEFSMEIDFPLPKPVEVEELPTLFVDSDVELKDTLNTNNLRVSNSTICSERTHSLSQARSGNKYTCGSDEDVNRNEISLRRSQIKNSRKRQTNFKSIMSNAGKRKGTQLSRNSMKVEKKKSIPFSNYSKSQEEIFAFNKRQHISLRCANGYDKRCSPNKRKMSIFSSTDHNVNTCERRQKMPIPRQMHSREIHVQDVSQQQSYLTTCNDPKGANIMKQPDNAQHITYHLEKLPYKYQAEVLNEKKRLALLKLLAQQLANRIDSAQTCTLSLAHTSTVQEHAFLLSYNLAKFQKKLRCIKKALAVDCVQSANEKTSGYIVLPHKYQQSYRDLSPKQRIGKMENVLTDEISSSDARHNAVKSLEEKNLEKSLANCKPGEGVQMWDHQFLTKDLEKLDAEIRETKARMANKLVSVSPSIDQELVTSVSSNLENDNSVPHRWTMSIDDDARSQRMSPVCNEYHTDLGSHPFPTSEIIESNMKDDMNRKQDDSIKVEEIEYNDFSSNENILEKHEEYEVLPGNKLINSSDCATELKAKKGRDCHVAVTSNFLYNADGSSSDLMALDVSCSGQAATIKEVPDDASLCVIPEMENNASNNEQPKDSLMEMTSQSKTKKETISESITDSLMQELFDNELSDVLLHYRSICFLRGRHISSSPSSISSTYHPVNGQDQHESHIADVTQYNSMKYRFDMHERSHDVHNEFLNVISKGLDKIVHVFCEDSSSLLDTYASSETMSAVVRELISKECCEMECLRHGKLLVDAICECLDNCYSHFYIPSFFLCQRACPDGAQLKQTVMSKLSEQAIALCEGGFSLDHMVVRYADQEYRRTHYCEMMDIVGDVSEHVLQDMVENVIVELGGPEAYPTVKSSTDRRQLVQFYNFGKKL